MRRCGLGVEGETGDFKCFTPSTLGPARPGLFFETLGQKKMAMTGKNRIMIFSPKNDGTYIIEFRTAAGEAVASSLDRSGVRVAHVSGKASCSRKSLRSAP